MININVLEVQSFPENKWWFSTCSFHRRLIWIRRWSLESDIAGFEIWI